MSHSSDSDSDDFDNVLDDVKVSFAQAKLFKLRFGQHSGKTLGKVAKTSKGRGYLRYLLTWSELRDETKANVECVMDKFETAKAKALAAKAAKAAQAAPAAPAPEEKKKPEEEKKPEEKKKDTKKRKKQA
jgi:hypothetical protein